VLSQGFEKDIRTIISEVLPKEYQAVLVSATMTSDLETLKGLILRHPVSVMVADSDISGQEPPKKKSPSSSTLLANPKCPQYYIECAKRDKYLCLYGIVKLELVSGRTLIFTSSVDSAYRLKIFFDKFAIASAVFNSEMPLECRHRVLSAFNDGLVNILIACEDSNVSADPETAAHRGIDFSNVAVVINLDLPSNVANYVHRAGRTARGGKSGVVLSFVDPENQTEISLLNQVQKSKNVEHMDIPIKAFEALRYRVEDVYKGISRRAIAAARQKEILSEMLHNEQLKQKLSENTQDVQALRHAMRTLREHSKVKWHLKEIPDYLMLDLGKVPSITGSQKRKPQFDTSRESTVKRRKITLREKMIKRDGNGDDDTTAPEDLAPISGRKLWKVRHHKRTKRYGDHLGKPPRVARKLWKTAKKFT
jgi:ATP-dependent RNA helicase DDX56/DBP9